jgi:predicted transcriptional regulator
MNPVLESILGSRSATQVLLFLENYGEGHASRISKTFDVSVMGVQRQLKRLEENGVLVSRMVGSSRIFSFNDRIPTVKHLRVFLDAELEMLPTKTKMEYFRQRQRPRRSGKPF